MKPIYYMLLIFTNILMVTAADRSLMNNTTTLGKRSREDTPSTAKKQRLPKTIYLQSTVLNDSNELIPIDLETAQQQSLLLGTLIYRNTTNNIDPPSLTYQFPTYDTQTLQDLVTLMEAAQQNRPEIYTVMNNIALRRKDRFEPFYWHKESPFHFAKPAISDLETRLDPYLFVLLRAIEAFKLSHAAKHALIDNIMMQTRLDEFTQLETILIKYLRAEDILKYISYLAKIYFLNRKSVPEQWKNVKFDISFKEIQKLAPHLITFNQDPIGELWQKDLVTLNLSGLYISNLNGINELKNQFKLPKKLAIDLTDNQLETIPKEIMELNPTYIDVSNNHFDELPEFLFHHAPQLKALNATHNYLTHIPDLNESALEILYLSDNLISDFPTSAPELSALFLIKNDIKRLPSISPENFPVLDIIDVSDNPITHIPEHLELTGIKLFIADTQLDEEQINRIKEAIGDTGQIYMD